MNIPGIKEILAVVNNMPEQFATLKQGMDTLATGIARVVELLEEQNELLRSNNGQPE